MRWVRGGRVVNERSAGGSRLQKETFSLVGVTEGGNVEGGSARIEKGIWAAFISLRFSQDKIKFFGVEQGGRESLSRPIG